MKERPILMSAPMVRAILDGRKTQTRRVMKVQPPSSAYELALCVSTTERSNRGKLHWIHRRGLNVLSAMPEHFAPRAAVGDRLWVKETFRVVGWDVDDDDVRIAYEADHVERCRRFGGADYGLWIERQCRRFARSGAVEVGGEGDSRLEMPDGVQPPLSSSLHMPRWASRITLTITEVRCQRLQDITEEDAIAEGARSFPDIPDDSRWGDGSRWSMESPTSTDQCLGSPRFAFANIINRINGPDAWDRNPWMWALTFTSEVRS